MKKRIVAIILTLVVLFSMCGVVSAEKKGSITMIYSTDNTEYMWMDFSISYLDNSVIIRLPDDYKCAITLATNYGVFGKAKTKSCMYMPDAQVTMAEFSSVINKINNNYNSTNLHYSISLDLALIEIWKSAGSPRYSPIIRNTYLERIKLNNRDGLKDACVYCLKSGIITKSTLEKMETESIYKIKVTRDMASSLLFNYFVVYCGYSVIKLYSIEYKRNANAITAHCYVPCGLPGLPPDGRVLH